MAAGRLEYKRNRIGYPTLREIAPVVFVGLRSQTGDPAWRFPTTRCIAHVVYSPDFRVRPSLGIPVQDESPQPVYRRWRDCRPDRATDYPSCALRVSDNSAEETANLLPGNIEWAYLVCCITRRTVSSEPFPTGVEVQLYTHPEVQVSPHQCRTGDPETRQSQCQILRWPHSLVADQDDVVQYRDFVLPWRPQDGVDSVLRIGIGKPQRDLLIEVVSHRLDTET